MTLNQSQKALSDIIEEIQSNPKTETDNHVSNLRVIHELVSSGRINELKKVLVENFSEYYGHTMRDENPADVLTMHSLENTTMTEMAKQSDDFSGKISENISKPFNIN